MWKEAELRCSFYLLSLFLELPVQLINYVFFNHVFSTHVAIVAILVQEFDSEHI